MAKRLSSQHFTSSPPSSRFVMNRLKGKPFDQSAARADRVSLVLPSETPVVVLSKGM